MLKLAIHANIRWPNQSRTGGLQAQWGRAKGGPSIKARKSGQGFQPQARLPCSMCRADPLLVPSRPVKICGKAIRRPLCPCAEGERLDHSGLRFAAGSGRIACVPAASRLLGPAAIAAPCFFDLPLRFSFPGADQQPPEQGAMAPRAKTMARGALGQGNATDIAMLRLKGITATFLAVALSVGQAFAPVDGDSPL